MDKNGVSDLSYEKDSDIHNGSNENGSAFHSYGGSRYRLAYDKYENRTVKKRSPRRIWEALIIVAVLSVFLVLGHFIYGYYKKSLRETADSNSSDQAQASFVVYN